MYLAIQMWFAPVSRLDEEKDTAIPIRTGRLFIASLMLTMGNPKVMVFFIALLPLIIDLRSMTMGLYAAVALAIVVILSGVLFAYTFAALLARRLFRRPFALRRSEEHTPELQSLMRSPYAVSCLQKKHTSPARILLYATH